MKRKARKADESFEAIQEAWRSLYHLGDEAIARMRAAAVADDMRALGKAMESFDLVRDAERRLRSVQQIAFVGIRFKRGRAVGAVSPIRKAIARVLAKSRNIKARDLWERFATTPPRGWTFYDTHAMGPKGAGMGRSRFANIVTEERKNLTD